MNINNMNILTSYQTNNTNPSFTGIVNMQNLKNLMKEVEPEAIKKITKDSLEDFAKTWVDIPNAKLDVWFSCHDLNLALKRNNIQSLLEKRGFSSKDDFFYDVSNNVTDENYNLAVLLAKEKSTSLIDMRYILGLIKEGKMRLEDAFAQFRKAHNTNGDYRFFEKFANNTTKRKVGWTREQFISHIQGKINNRNFQKSDLKDSEIRNLAKLLGTTEEQVRNMDKQEYRRLSIKFHPDSAEKGKEDIFSILNNLYNCK